jgi:FolB domain-containing protein
MRIGGPLLILAVKSGEKMDQILISDLLVRGIIGINDWEREKPQNINLNITLFADLRQAGETDDIAYSVSYRTIAKKAQAHAEKAQRFTVEALAEDIARLCLEEPNVVKVRVRVEKPGAARFARSVGVEIERSREG